MSHSNKVFLSIIFFVLCFAQFTDVSAQYYRLIDKDRDMTFARLAESGADSVFYFIEVDSFTLEDADTVFYFNKQLAQTADPACPLQLLDTVILGTKVKVMNDTDITYVFFNQHNDSIFIHSQVEVGDVWHVYEWPDGTYVKATVVNELERTILPDVLDTIMRIQLNVVTAAGVTLPDVFPNATKIDISKEHGITEFFNFNIFPLPGDSIGRVLRGLTEPDENIVDVDAQNAFNFESGFEFHYRETVVPGDVAGADKRVSAWKYFVMAKTELADGVSYTMERVMFDTLFYDGAPSSNIVWDTVELTYLYADYAFLDTLEFSVFENTNHGYSDWVKSDTLYKGFAHKYVYDWFTYDETTTCLSNPDAISMPEQLYGDGLGVMYYLDSASAENYYALDMVYFHIGLLEWGTPYDFSALDLDITTQTIAEHITIYPNPTQDLIYLDLPTQANGVLHIFNAQGVLVSTISMNIPSDHIKVDVSAFADGYYYVQLQDASRMAVGSFVKF